MAKHEEHKEHERHEKKREHEEHRARGGHMRHRREKGGLVEEPGPRNEQDYTPKDVAIMKESKDKKDSFKRGGHVKKRRRGGHAEGDKEHHRLDKRARGGHVKHHGMASGGHSPMTHAAHVEGRPGGDYDGNVDRRDD